MLGLDKKVVQDLVDNISSIAESLRDINLYVQDKRVLNREKMISLAEKMLNRKENPSSTDREMLKEKFERIYTALRMIIIEYF